jgi:hypothetical protein
MSALAPIAARKRTSRDVRVVPQPALSIRSKRQLFDRLADAGEQRFSIRAPIRSRTLISCGKAHAHFSLQAFFCTYSLVSFASFGRLQGCSTAGPFIGGYGPLSIVVMEGAAEQVVGSTFS